MLYAQRLVNLDMYSVEGRLLRADLIKIFHGLSQINPTDLFTLAPPTGTRGHCFKILIPYSRCDARHRFFSVRVVRPWNFLPSNLVDSDSLSTFMKGPNALGDQLFEFYE